MNKTKSRIAFIIPTLNSGGAERVVSNLSIELSPFYDVFLIVFDNTKQSYPSEGVLIDLHLPSKNGFFGKLLTLKKRIRAVKKIKKTYDIDCAISFMSGPSYVNVCSSKKDKTIVSVRNNMTLSQISSFEKKMMTESCKKANAVVSLSQTIKNDLVQNFSVQPASIFTIYNSVDGERLLSLSQSQSHDINSLVGCDFIINVGRITKQKGQWHLIKSFSILAKKYCNLKLVILGQGEEAFMNKLRSLITKLKLDDRVIFLGYVKNPHSIIANSKLFVFSSLFEGLGNSILEALACQKAVISTDCIAGPREILAPNTDPMKSVRNELKQIEYAEYGVLVPSFSQEDDFDNIEINNEESMLSKAIEELLNNDSLRKQYEEKCLKRTMDFSPKKITSQWISLINMLLDSNHK